MRTTVPIPMYMPPPSPSHLFPAVSIAKRRGDEELGPERTNDLTAVCDSARADPTVCHVMGWSAIATQRCRRAQRRR